MDTPLLLYQYCSYDKAFDLLKTGKMRLSNVMTFNDPFEFLPVSEFAHVLQKKDITHIENLLSELEKVSSDKKGKLSKLSFFDYLTSSQHLIKSIMWYLKDESIKHDIMNFEQEIKILRNYLSLCKSFCIACFSEDNKNLLLWSHYAIKHTGVVLSFKNALDYWENNIHQVSYSNDRISPQELFSSGDKIPNAFYHWQRNLLVTKASVWQYEKEWRFLKLTQMCEEDENGFYKNIEKNCLDKIILGCCMEKSKKEVLSTLVLKEWPYVEIYEAKLENKAFGLNYVKIAN